MIIIRIIVNFVTFRTLLTALIASFTFVVAAQTGPGGISTNLSIWYKGNSGTTTSGNSLTDWTDQSGNGFNITQGVSTNQPQLQQNDINFNPGIVFDGGSDYLPISTKNYNGTGALSALTTLVVFKTTYSGSGYNNNWSFLDFDRSDFFNVYIHGANGNISFSYRSSGTTYDNDAPTTGLNDGYPHIGVAGYNNAVTNETTIRVDGLQDLASNRVANGATIGVSGTRYGFVGDGSEANSYNGTRNNIYYDGSIAEVIHFERSLNATELNRVESYLAVKYGLTLGNTGNVVSYTSSNGTVIWTGSATYQNGIAGIGRDDNSILDQSRSLSSTDNNSLILIGAEAAFGSDLSFLMWGHDDAGTNLTTTNLPAGFEQRLEKTWTVQSTGTPGSVTLDFVITSSDFNSYSAGDYTLLIDADGDFTSGHTEHAAATIVGDTVRFTGVTFSSGEYFTIAGPNLKSPGGFSTGLQLWFRADAGIISSGGFVSDWKDNGPQQNHAIQASSSEQPAILSSDINYNPGISFDDIDDYLPISQVNYTGAGSLSQVLSIVVYKTSVSGGNNDNWAFLDFDRSEYFNFSIKGNGGLRFSYSNGGNTYDLDGSTNGMNDGLAKLGVAIYDNSLTNETEIRADGMRDYYSDNLTNGATLGSANTRFGIIGDGSEASSFNSSINNNYYGGEIAEIIYFDNQSYSASQLQILESYLGIKYGITLSKDTDGNSVTLEATNGDGVHEGDYVSSAGTIIWDASANDGHDNGIIGLGRDDNTALLQKQSHWQDDSLRVYMQTLAASNVSNSATKASFGSDDSFLVIGHDGTPLYDSGVKYGEWPGGVYSRVDRELKVQNTNFTASFSMDITLNAYADLGASDPDDLVLLVDTDDNFADASIFGIAEGLTFSISSNTLTIGGITNAVVPANSSRYLAVGTTSSSTSLPIELISFDGEMIGSHVKLKWRVATEINNDFFTVEKSADGVKWAIVDIVEGAGNSTTETSYFLADKNPLRGVSYYRLKQTDFDGRYEYFNPIAINNVAETKANIYPNPADRYVNISSPDETAVIIKLYSVSGTLIYSDVLENFAKNIDTSELKNGVYILMLNDHKHLLKVEH